MAERACMAGGMLTRRAAFGEVANGGRALSDPTVADVPAALKGAGVERPGPLAYRHGGCGRLEMEVGGSMLSPEQLETTLAEIVRRLREALSPSAIYLFGSYAYGSPQRHSDLDLLVIIEDSPLGPYQRDAKAYLALCGLGVPKDVMVYTRQEFERRAALRTSFERTVKNKGKLLYVA